jgi:hypothetical protein
MPELSNIDILNKQTAVIGLAQLIQALKEDLEKLKNNPVSPPPAPSAEQPITDEVPQEEEDEQEGGVDDENFIPEHERVVTDDEVEERPVPPRRSRAIGSEEAVDDYVDMTNKMSNTCQKLPFEIKKRKNRFVDTLVYATDEIQEVPEKLIEQQKRAPKRPKIKPVKVKCSECKRAFLVDAQLAPRRITAEDGNRYVCNDCIGQSISSRRK